MVGPLIQSKSQEFLERLLGFIINTTSNDKNRQMLVKSGIFKDLIPLLSHGFSLLSRFCCLHWVYHISSESENVLRYCALALRNLFYEQDNQLAFIEAGGAKALVESRLYSAEIGLDSEWTTLVAMLSFYRSDIRQKLVEAQVLGVMNRLLAGTVDPQVQDQIYRALSYLTGL